MPEKPSLWHWRKLALVLVLATLTACSGSIPEPVPDRVEPPKEEAEGSRELSITLVVNKEVSEFSESRDYNIVVTYRNSSDTILLLDKYTIRGNYGIHVSNSNGSRLPGPLPSPPSPDPADHLTALEPGKSITLSYPLSGLVADPSSAHSIVVIYRRPDGDTRSYPHTVQSNRVILD